MELWRGLRPPRPSYRGAIVTIGSFDGIHRGHQALIEASCAEARQRRRSAVMLSFEPMPREFLQRNDPPARLTNFRERWRALARSGLDALWLLRFDERLRNLSGEAFVAILTQHLAVSVVVVGHDFRFGRDGGADVDLLRRAGRRDGFEVKVIEPVQLDEERVSSSALRAALAAGDLPRAARLLGRPYSLIGRVARGDQLGRTLGFPTANIRLKRRRIPLWGIYAVRVHGLGGQPWGGVASLGTRPTVGGQEPLLETHLLDWSGDLYGRELEIEFVAHLREERRFESLEAMRLQMHIDVAQARERIEEDGRKTT